MPASILRDPSQAARADPAVLGHGRSDRRCHGGDHELGRPARHRHARHLDGAAYDQRRRDGKIDMRANPTVAKETPVSALVDGGGGLGHANARRAMELAIEKAKTVGIGVAVVRNSAHFGACGFYALMAVEAGLIGMVATSASGIQVAPTTAPRPARHGSDRLRRSRQAGRALPARHGDHHRGRGQDPQQGQRKPARASGLAGHLGGQAQHRSARGEQSGFTTPLGGTPEGSSHKGYGLGAMVNILSSGAVGCQHGPPTRSTPRNPARLPSSGGAPVSARTLRGCCANPRLRGDYAAGACGCWWSCLSVDVRKRTPTAPSARLTLAPAGFDAREAASRCWRARLPRRRPNGAAPHPFEWLEVDCYRYSAGRIIARHMCATGLLSKPSPCSGWRKLRPMMSVNSSSSTCTLGSNE